MVAVAVAEFYDVVFSYDVYIVDLIVGARVVYSVVDGYNKGRFNIYGDFMIYE